MNRIARNNPGEGVMGQAETVVEILSGSEKCMEYGGSVVEFLPAMWEAQIVIDAFMISSSSCSCDGPVTAEYPIPSSSSSPV